MTNKTIAGVGSFIALVTFGGCVTLGKAVDCKPHEIDGQCGLTSFMGFLSGLAALLLISILTSVVIGIRIWLHGRHIQESSV